MGCGGSTEAGGGEAPVTLTKPDDVAVSMPRADRLRPSDRITDLSDVIGLEVDVRVAAGRNLVAKDGRFIGKRTSDPYVVVRFGSLTERSAHVDDDLNPTWDFACKLHVQGKAFKPREISKPECAVQVCVYDRDEGGMFDSDDPMGVVTLPLSALLTASGGIDKWLPVDNCAGCTNASGELHVVCSALPRKALSLKQRDSLAVQDAQISFGLGWDMPGGRRAIDLDTSCVAFGKSGEVIAGECVYFARLRSASGAIIHTGDEQEGDEDLGQVGGMRVCMRVCMRSGAHAHAGMGGGCTLTRTRCVGLQGDDEIVTVDLGRVPPSVKALFIIATVASEGRTFGDVKSARLRMFESASGAERLRFYPATKGAHTALFLCRLTRMGYSGLPTADWAVQMIGDSDHTGRDWGTLVPEMKLYLSDLVPGIATSPDDRVAVMRKGGRVRLADYTTRFAPPTTVEVGLAWDVTDGVNIDLDASVVVLDGGLRLLDVVYFGKLRSSDGAIAHGGDEREGDAQGDDEKISIDLGRVHPQATFLCVCINSYSGQVRAARTCTAACRPARPPTACPHSPACLPKADSRGAEGRLNRPPPPTASSPAPPRGTGARRRQGRQVPPLPQGLGRGARGVRDD